MCKPAWESMMNPGDDLPFELKSWVDLAPFERTLGMKIVSSGGGEAVLAMPFRIMLAQGMGLMHGGAITALADTAAAMAIKTLLPEGTHFATVDLSTRFLSPVRGGVVTAHARAGREPEDDRIFTCSVSVTDEEGVDVAAFRSSFRVARARHGDRED